MAESPFGLIQPAGPYTAWRFAAGSWRAEATGGNELAMLRRYPNFVIRKTSLGEPPAQPKSEE